MTFALAASLLAALLFGLFPALHSSRIHLDSVLRDGGRWGTGLRQNKARAIFVVSEVCLAMILLVGSALLIRSFAALYKVDRGFETKNVLTMRTLLAGPKYATSAGVENAIRNGLERIRALPGVEAASTTCCVPLQGQNGLPFGILGTGDSSQSAGWTTISPGFFDVFKIPVTRGRAFTDRDSANAPPVVMINEAMAKLYFKGDPLKERIVIGRKIMKEFQNEPARQVIGVVADVRDTGLANTPRPVMYVPWAQLPDVTDAFWNEPMAWVVRTRTPPRKLIPAIQEQLRQATGVPVSDLLLMDDVVSLSTTRQRFSMLLMSIFGCAALLLAAIGIYGLMAYTVEQRTQEIGIRLALGAEATQLRNMVVASGHESCDGRHRHRSDRRVGRIAPDGQPPVRSETARPSGLHCGSSSVSRSSSVVRLAPRKTRATSRPGSRPAARLTTASQQFDDRLDCNGSHLRNLGKDSMERAYLKRIVERNCNSVNWRPVVAQPDVTALLTYNSVAELFQESNYAVCRNSARYLQAASTGINSSLT